MHYSSEASCAHSEIITYLVSLGHNFDFEGTNIGLVKLVTYALVLSSRQIEHFVQMEGKEIKEQREMTPKMEKKKMKVA